MEKSVGVRELRDGLTRYLGRIRPGDRLVITDRGQPVALLLPYRRGKVTSRGERLAALFASGQVIPAQRRFTRRPPLVRTRGRSMVELVVEDRR